MNGLLMSRYKYLRTNLDSVEPAGWGSENRDADEVSALSFQAARTTKNEL